MPDTFIQRYVFPDGELHEVAKVIATAERAGQELRDDESLREHYALTLRHWVANLEQNREAAIAEVGTERERVWRLYMTASALAFERGDVSIHQMLMAMPGEEAHPLSTGSAELRARRHRAAGRRLRRTGPTVGRFQTAFGTGMIPSRSMSVAVAAFTGLEIRYP